MRKQNCLILATAMLTVLITPASARENLKLLRFSKTLAYQNITEIKEQVDIQEEVGERQNVRFEAAEIDLGPARGKELFVRIIHPDFCGPAFCPIRAITRKGAGAKSLFWAHAQSIYVSNRKSHGYRNIHARIGGGATQIYTFDGEYYIAPGMRSN